MSDENNKNNGSNNNNDAPKPNNTNLSEDTKTYSDRFGESKAQQDQIQKGGEITPRPTPPKNDNNNNSK